MNRMKTALQFSVTECSKDQWGVEQKLTFNCETLVFFPKVQPLSIALKVLHFLHPSTLSHSGPYLPFAVFNYPRRRVHVCSFQQQTSNLWPPFCLEDIRSIISLIRALHLFIVDLLSLWQLTVYWTPVIPASDPVKQGSVQNRRDLISMCWENVGLEGQTQWQQE